MPKRKRKNDGGSKKKVKYKGVTKSGKKFEGRFMLDGTLQPCLTHPRRLLKRTIVLPSKQDVQHPN